MRTSAFLAALGTAVLVAFPGAAGAADAARGHDLYEQRCGGCHFESVHGRAKRIARDFGEIRAFVIQRSAMLDLRWGAEEVEDVTLFLNETYYHYPVPALSAKRRIPPVAANTQPR